MQASFSSKEDVQLEHETQRKFKTESASGNTSLTPDKRKVANSIEIDQLTRKVHKPLRDLINHTNKTMYNVDVDTVKFRVGLSRNQCMRLPSLHSKKCIAENETN